MSQVWFDDSVLDRMVLAVEKVRERLKRTARALDAAGIPYAVAGGNAVAAWVAKVEPAAVRNTRDVDIVLRRQDLEAAKVAMQAAGFTYRRVKSIDMFLDGPDSKARDAVHILFAGEKVKPDALGVTAEIVESERADTETGENVSVVSLEALVRMKLIAWRDKDRTHLRDMIEVGILSDSWPARFGSELGDRLQELLDDPDG